MMNKTLRTTLLATIVVAAFSGTARAGVEFDPATGIGSVGKGDVQEAFGWNDADLQAKADGVTFTYEASTGYEAVCEWTTGPVSNRRTHQVAHTESIEIDHALQSAARKNPQNKVTGFTLTGYGITASVGEVPVVGGKCQGEGLNDHTGGVWVEVNVLDATEGGLYVNYGATSVLLQP